MLFRSKMITLEQKLTATVIEAIKTLYSQDIPEKMVQLQKTKKEFEGHLTLVVFPFLKMARKSPVAAAHRWAEPPSQDQAHRCCPNSGKNPRR